MNFLSPNDFHHVQLDNDDFIGYFPLVTSVVDKIQKGYVLEHEGSFIIVNNFGFAYILGNPIDLPHLIRELKAKLKLLAPKLRIYDPNNLLGRYENFLPFQAHRKKLILDVEQFQTSQSKNSSNNCADIQNVYDNCGLDYSHFSDLDLFHRYWIDKHDFEKNSSGVLNVRYHGICYAASVNKRLAEIDIFVDSKSRNKGIGSNLVNHFSSNTLQHGITPLWDCYSNNLSSLTLALKNMFIPLFDYEYYNLDLNKT
jgi:hypothetical protein